MKIDELNEILDSTELYLANLIKGGDKKRHKYTTSKLIE